MAFRPMMVGLVVPLLMAGGAQSSEAQSLFGARGLGFPLDGSGARAQALGGVATGLSGTGIIPQDPAASADLLVPTILFVTESSWIDVEHASAESSASGTRFPLIGVAYPVADHGIATLTFSGVLDQRWDVRHEHDVDLEDETVRVTDTFVSDGGLSALRLGFARRISPGVALGITAGSHLGSVSRTFTRSFEMFSDQEDVPDFTTEGRWNYTGPTVGAGVEADFGELLRVGGSVVWNGDVEASPADDTEGEETNFDLPTRFEVGASGALAPALRLALGLKYADWSGTSDDGGEGVGTGVLGVGGGLEWEGITFLGRTAPVRLGYRTTGLPFRFDGESGRESAATAGLGIGFIRQDVDAVAGIELAVERGERSAGSFSESYWRTTVSLRVTGL